MAPKTTVLNLPGHSQNLLFQPTAHFNAPSSQHSRCLFQSHTCSHPGQIQGLAHLGDSRDKDGIDEVGGTDGGGGGLPAPEQWVKVAAVQNRLVVHGRGSATQSSLLDGGSWVSAAASAL